MSTDRTPQQILEVLLADKQRLKEVRQQIADLQVQEELHSEVQESEDELCEALDIDRGD